MGVTILAAARGNVRVDAMAIGGGHTHHHNHHHDHGHGWFKSRAARDLEKWHKTQEGRAALELADRETRGAASTKALQMVKDHVANEAPKPDTLVHHAQPHEIDQTTRWVIATFLNRLIHVPMMNPMTNKSSASRRSTASLTLSSASCAALARVTFLTTPWSTNGEVTSRS